MLDVDDIERVHDMRVATRRLRAALEIFGPCFPRGELKAALREVKALADALGERRDRDVAIAALEDIAESMAAPDRPGIETLIARLRAEQAAANEALARFVTADHLASLCDQLDRARRKRAAACPQATAAETLEARGCRARQRCRRRRAARAVGERRMKARRVKRLDPATSLEENAARIVAVRLDEMRSFMPARARAGELRAPSTT